MNMKKVNQRLNEVTLQTIETHKKLSQNEILGDLTKLKELDVTTHKNNFYGNL